MFEAFEACALCPRRCGVNRNKGEPGYCRSDNRLMIGSICIHRGEEPIVSGKNGICNVFFSHCNMECIFCQNHQISRKDISSCTAEYTVETAAGEIASILDTGLEAVGFVTPTHFSPYVKAIITELHRRNYFPVTVYNTNGYENPEIIADLEGFINVYLPDFKYIDPCIAKQYSSTADYPEHIKRSLYEMYRQKGTTVAVNENGYAVTGLIIRHLVLPGNTKGSIQILEWIAEHLSTSVTISLMSQYYPTPQVANHKLLHRSLFSFEYNKVVKRLEELGFCNGWIQEIESQSQYKPDFSMDRPFEYS